LNPDLQPRYPGEWLGLSALVSVSSIGIDYAFLAALPACGPPRNTGLGQIYFVVPFAILFVAALVLIGLGRVRKWQVSRIVGAVIAMIALTLAGEVVVFFHFFAMGNCGE
jgi:hypothetical protein